MDYIQKEFPQSVLCKLFEHFDFFIDVKIEETNPYNWVKVL